MKTKLPEPTDYGAYWLGDNRDGTNRLPAIFPFQDKNSPSLGQYFLCPMNGPVPSEPDPNGRRRIKPFPSPQEALEYLLRLSPAKR